MPHGKSIWLIHGQSFKVLAGFFAEHIPVNQLRIIAGRWRGKKIHFVDQEGLRPTADRIRETLFNWLQGDITDSICLDLFAGSGALGIEAASRGAGDVYCVESSSAAAKAIRENLATLADAPVRVINTNALDFLQRPQATLKFDVVFLDPPFASRLLEQACDLLEKQQWLTPHAAIYLESAQPLETLSLPLQWQLAKHKKAGQVYYGLCRRSVQD